MPTITRITSILRNLSCNYREFILRSSLFSLPTIRNSQHTALKNRHQPILLSNLQPLCLKSGNTRIRFSPGVTFSQAFPRSSTSKPSTTSTVNAVCHSSFFENPVILFLDLTSSLRGNKMNLSPGFIAWNKSKFSTLAIITLCNPTRRVE